MLQVKDKGLGYLCEYVDVMEWEEIEPEKWIEANIFLPPTAAEPGQLKLSRTPYVRGVLRALRSDYIDWVVLVWGRQVAKTQTVINYLAYCVSNDPGIAMLVYPSDKKAKEMSTERIKKVFDYCEAITNKKNGNEE